MRDFFGLLSVTIAPPLTAFARYRRPRLAQALWIAAALALVVAFVAVVVHAEIANGAEQ